MTKEYRLAKGHKAIDWQISVLQSQIAELQKKKRELDRLYNIHTPEQIEALKKELGYK